MKNAIFSLFIVLCFTNCNKKKENRIVENIDLLGAYNISLENYNMDLKSSFEELKVNYNDYYLINKLNVDTLIKVLETPLKYLNNILQIDNSTNSFAKIRIDKNKFIIKIQEIEELKKMLETCNNLFTYLNNSKIFIGNYNYIFENEKFVVGNSEQLLLKGNGLDVNYAVQKIKNNLLQVFNNYLIFYVQNVPIRCNFNSHKYLPLVHINKSIFSKGENATLTLGMTNFERVNNYEVFVENIKLQTLPFEYVEYSFKCPNKIGKFSKNIRFVFNNPNTGELMDISKNLRYEVK